MHKQFNSCAINFCLDCIFAPTGVVCTTICQSAACICKTLLMCSLFPVQQRVCKKYALRSLICINMYFYTLVAFWRRTIKVTEWYSYIWYWLSLLWVMLLQSEIYVPKLKFNPWKGSNQLAFPKSWTIWCHRIIKTRAKYAK